MIRSRTKRQRAGALALAGTTALAGAAAFLAPGAGVASSHREAPLTAADPLIDNTDVYAFVSPDKADTVTFIANWIPFQEPNGGPNFYPWADQGTAYDIKIDNNGDAVEDITYRWTFTSSYKTKDTFLYATGPVESLDSPNLNFTQTYKLEKITAEGEPEVLVESGKVAPSLIGPAATPNYAALRDEAITKTADGGVNYVGQADDPFFLDLRVFDLLYGTDLSETGTDTLTGYNVNTIALQVPKAEVLAEGSKDPVIGIWSTTSRPGMRETKADGTQTYSGDLVQVSRLGNPLVNEVVIPLELKDAFNALPPAKDASVEGAVNAVNNPEVPRLVEKIYGIPAPKTPRDDLFAVFLTGVEGLNKPMGEVVPAEMLRLNTSIAPAAEPNRLGVLAKDTAGFPNGRRLTDDVVDIGLQALEGAVRTGKIVEPLAKGDGVNQNDREFGEAFPYLALPHENAVSRASTKGGSAGAKGSSGSGSSTTPQGGVAAGGGGSAGDSGIAAALALLGGAFLLLSVRSLRKA